MGRNNFRVINWGIFPLHGRTPLLFGNYMHLLHFLTIRFNLTTITNPLLAIYFFSLSIVNSSQYQSIHLIYTRNCLIYYYTSLAVALLPRHTPPHQEFFFFLNYFYPEKKNFPKSKKKNPFLPKIPKWVLQLPPPKHCRLFRRHQALLRDLWV
jgi:hypothetical protein